MKAEHLQLRKAHCSQFYKLLFPGRIHRAQGDNLLRDACRNPVRVTAPAPRNPLKLVLGDDSSSCRQAVGLEPWIFDHRYLGEVFSEHRSHRLNVRRNEICMDFPGGLVDPRPDYGFDEEFTIVAVRRRTMRNRGLAHNVRIANRQDTGATRCRPRR